MTDQPIVVNANPLTDQASALLRVAVIALGAVAAAFGFAKASGTLETIANLAGPIVTAVSAVVALGTLVWSQIKTRLLSQKAATMANALPDSVATTK